MSDRLVSRQTKTLVDPDGILREVDFDAAESPLGWLRSRKDKAGEPLISADEFEAGERLRRDYTLAGLIARTTMNWDGLGGRAERRSAGGGRDLNAASLDARARVNAVIRGLGPDLASVAIDVCCHFAGLADIERLHGWPQRSGKVVLRLALAALARYYGIDAEATGGERTATRHWGTSDFRPKS
ncbi:DUF6456 domain-containing protein [Pleomorphomonas koreensis]|uniref:DUF6456 domain-containing protein n=1 Tax=Pleomorphomonas koreensis TaxID=257440 RepID=UPI0003FB2A0A|nr:DUF6456 domain-containing protein [Pleomorphomonas koreensis]